MGRAILFTPLILTTLILWEARAEDTGAVLVTGEPDVCVYIDDVFRARLAHDCTELLMTRLAVGPHKVLARRPGYVSRACNFVVHPGQTVRIDLRGRWTVLPRSMPGYGAEKTRPRSGPPSASKAGESKTRGSRLWHFGVAFPVASMPVLHYDRGFPGLSVELGYRLAPFFSMLGEAFVCGTPNAPPLGWYGIRALGEFNIGTRGFAWFFRIGPVLSYLSGEAGYSDYRSFGFGASLSMGARWSLGRKARLDVFAGMDLHAIPHQSLHDWYWGGEDNHASLYGGLRLAFLA